MEKLLWAGVVSEAWQAALCSQPANRLLKAWCGGGWTEKQRPLLSFSFALRHLGKEMHRRKGRRFWSLSTPGRQAHPQHHHSSIEASAAQPSGGHLQQQQQQQQ